MLDHSGACTCPLCCPSKWAINAALLASADHSLMRQMNSKVIAEEDLERLQRIEAAAKAILQCLDESIEACHIVDYEHIDSLRAALKST